MEVFDFINSHRLAELINSTQTRLIVVVPAISKEVADAIVKAKGRVRFLRVVLDPNEWVYRIGFGEIEGLSTLENAGIEVNRCSGLRIGLIETDGDLYIFSPTPQNVEVEPTHRQTPNAIRISTVAVDSIVEAIAPESVNSSKIPEIGSIKMTQEEIQIAKKAIKDRPPVPPDLSRQITVLSSEFQFVETKFSGGRIQQRTVSLTAEDLGVRRKSLSKRIAGTYKIIEGAEISDLDSIAKKLQKIRKRYLIQIKHYGTVIDFRQKEEFKQAMEALKVELENVRNREELPGIEEPVRILIDLPHSSHISPRCFECGGVMVRTNVLEPQRLAAAFEIRRTRVCDRSGQPSQTDDSSLASMLLRGSVQ